MKRKQQLKAAVNKAVNKYVKNPFILTIARIRMRLGIKAVCAIHKMEAKNYLEKEGDNKNLKNYIVLLDRFKIKKVKGKSIPAFEERLFWINRKNFKKIRRAGWLPQKMRMDELRLKSFYVSSVRRNYEEEFKAREKANAKYINYLRSKYKM